MSDVKVEPLGARVIVRPLVEEGSRTGSGLFIPETAKERPQTGEVVAVGDNKEEIKVRAGQKVLFIKYTGTEIKLDGVDYLIMDVNDLLAVIND